MELNPVDSTKLVILMLFGAVSALAGLWLLLKPKGDGGATSIELFGLKFQSSSVGLLVFLVGAAFVAVPLFVAEQSAPPPAAQTGDTAKIRDPGKITPADPNTSGITATASPVDISKEGREIEPNNTAASANILPIGASVTGEVPKDDADAFRIDTQDRTGATLFVTLTGTNMDLQVFRPTGQMVQKKSVGFRSSGTIELPIEDAYYIARITTYGIHSTYELTVTAR